MDDSSGSQSNFELQTVEQPSIESLNEDARNFFEAVRQGNLEEARQYIERNLVDINSLDSYGLTALQIAVKEGHVAILVFLMDNGAIVGSALLDAINGNSIDCVSVLAQYYMKQKHRKSFIRNPSRSSGSSSSTGEESLYDTDDSLLPPLVLAAQNHNYEIVQYLLKEGYTIDLLKDTHKERQNSTELLGSYLFNLNTYKALASPEYICAQFFLQDNSSPSTENDPLYKALALKRKILQHAKVEYEFREDYKVLAENCEDFAVALLDQCRNLYEITIIMNLPELKGRSESRTNDELTAYESPEKLSILNFALKNKNKKFIAHRFSQVMLNSVFYSGVRGFEESNRVLSCLLVFLYWIIMPLVMTLYQILPGNHLMQLLEIPIIKYLSHVGSWVWLIMLMIVAAFQDKIPKSEITDIAVVEVVIGIWVAGMTLEEVKQFVRQGRARYVSQWWRVVAACVVACFFITGFLWVSDFAILAKSKGTVKVNATELNNFQDDILRQTLRLTANSFYALGVLLTFLQISHNFQVSYWLGPLHMSLMNMASDVIKFICIFSLAYLAFAVGLRELYSWYVATARIVALANNRTNSAHAMERLDGSFRHLFWSLFGLTEVDLFKTEAKYDRFKIINITGELMFALYNVVAILVALNLLIAMLTNTFQKIGGDSDTRFKVVRTNILMQYVRKGSVAPAPMNLIPLKYIYNCIFSGCKKCVSRTPSKDSIIFQQNRNRVMRAIVQRFLSKRKISLSQDRDSLRSTNSQDMTSGF